MERKERVKIMKAYSVAQLERLYDGEFRTKQRIFTTVDGILYVYVDGKKNSTWKKANLFEKIKSQVWAMDG